MPRDLTRLALQAARPIPRAAHVPSRCRGRRKAHVKAMQGFRAAINALYPKTQRKTASWKSSDCTPKNLPKTAPRASQFAAQDPPKPPKIEPWSVHGSPNVPKRCLRPAKRRPRAPKKRPRGAQEAPKSDQEPPKSAQKPAKRRPRGTQECPRPLQNGAQRVPRRVFSTIFVGSSVRQAPGTIFFGFLLVCNTRDVRKT